jgi:predicted RNA-binding Zn ribbon-like protein
MRTYPHTFRPADYVGGHVVVDLVNTVTGRDGDPVDWLDAYPQVLGWAALTGHFDDGALADLAVLVARRSGEATAAVDRLRDLRETVHELLEAASRGEHLPQPALARLEALWKEAAAAARLSAVDRQARLSVDVETSGPDFVAHALALEALELLGSLPSERLRVCAGRHCGWLFVDRSKAGRRRWCDMATCGNAAKSRRHYARTRGRR